MKTTIVTGGIICLAVLAGGRSQAQLINFDFERDSFTPNIPVHSGAAATGSAGDVWNFGEPEFVQSFADLLDSAGNPTSAALATEFFGSYSSTAANFSAPPDLNPLMQDYTFVNPGVNGAVGTATISGLAANAGYTLYLYGVSDSAGQNTTFTVSGSNEGTLPVTSPDLDGPLTEGDDYVVFTGNTGAGTIDITVDGNGGFAGWNGFQLEVGTAGSDPPTAPELVAPADAAADVSVFSTLEWNTGAGAASYGVYLWKSADPAPNPETDPPTATVTGLTYDSAELDPLASYSWLVNATNDHGEAASGTWTFTTGETPIPPFDTLINFDFEKGSSRYTGAAATGIPGDAWSGGDPEVTKSFPGLLDSDGNGTSVQLDVSEELKSSTTTDSDFGSSLNDLMRDYAFTHPDTTATATISGLEAGVVYTLYLYGVSNTATQQSDFAVVNSNEGTQTVTSPDVVGPLTLGDDYVIFTGTTSGTGTIDLSLTGGSNFASWNGFQLGLSPGGGPGLEVVLNDGNLDFGWNSQGGLLYDLVASSTLDSAPGTWLPVDGQTGIPADPSGTTTTSIPLPANPKVFYAVVEYPAPPLMEEDFEADDGGFTLSATEGTTWEWGQADSNNEFGLVVTGGNPSSLKCWAVGLGTYAGGPGNGTNEGTYANPTNTHLRSSQIDLTGVSGATLSFAEAIDAVAGDGAKVFVIDASDTVIGGTAIYDATEGVDKSENWTTANGGVPIALPAAAMGQTVRIEWRFTGAGTAYLGWYIDDVVVRSN